jgi:hypothetical protein
MPNSNTVSFFLDDGGSMKPIFLGKGDADGI